MKGNRGVWLGVLVAGALMVAGEVEAQEVRILAKGGAHWATVDWSPSPLGGGFAELERQRGPAFGVAATWAGRGRLRLHLEGQLTEKGFRELDGGTESSLRARYLEVPLLVGVALGDGDSRWDPQLFGGPWVAWEATCEASLREGSFAVDFDCDEVPDDPVLRQTTDWGLTAGGLVDVAISSSLRGRVDLRYVMGLRNVDGSPDIDNFDVNHRGFSATLGFGWAFGS